MNTKYEIIENTLETKSDYEQGMTYNYEGDQYPDILASYDTLKEAREALKAYECTVKDMSQYNVVTERYIEENVYDDDGEWVTGGDVWDYASYHPTFEQFYQKFEKQYQMTEIDHEGNLEYYYKDNDITVRDPFDKYHHIKEKVTVKAEDYEEWLGEPLDDMNLLDCESLDCPIFAAAMDELYEKVLEAYGVESFNKGLDHSLSDINLGDVYGLKEDKPSLIDTLKQKQALVNSNKKEDIKQKNVQHEI